MKKFSATYIKTLKESLVASHWYKNELRDYLRVSLTEAKLVDRLNWDDKNVKKRDLVDELFQGILDRPSTLETDVETLARGLLEMTRYPSLERHEDSKRKLNEAVKAREALRRCVEEHRKHSESRKTALEFDALREELERRTKLDDERKRRRALDDELRKNNPARYYGRILKLKGKVTKEGIKEKYRSLIKAYHPDKFSHLDEEFVELATERTQQIVEAYRYLAHRHDLER